ncbi:MAG: efflux RND transporter permease subunit, partial [Acidobacteriota bacterium]
RQRSRTERSDRLARFVSRVAVRWPRWVMVGTAVLLLLTILAAGQLDQQFFPAADRALVVIDLEMPEGTHLEGTDAVTTRFESALTQHPEVSSVATFIGSSAPKFYYNLLSRPNSPHRAQLLAEVTDLEAVSEVIVWARSFCRRELPEVDLVARRLEQGPPVEAPLEVRILGAELEDLEVVADEVLRQLREIPGTRDTRHDLGLGVPTVVFEIDDAAAARYGLTRADVAAVLRGRTLGSEVGQYRMGDDPIPILVRSSAGEQFPAADLATIDVAGAGGQAVPLSQVARLEVEWRPAAIYHYNRSRSVKVLSQLADGTTSQRIFEALEPRLAAMDLPPGVRFEFGGELEESGSANAAILGAMPLGLLMLLFFLLAEFNSFRRVGIILMTVPLAATGVVPGLLLSGNSFGFMSMLGVVSLVGIVVNNAIVLLDVIESLRAEGFSTEKALVEAVRRRTRPILLTMATTVAGLSPLAFSSTTLWPPLAWAMISGLIASTVLTLLVVPALYKLLFTAPSGPLFGASARRRAAASAAVLALVCALGWPAATHAVPASPEARAAAMGTAEEGAVRSGANDRDPGNPLRLTLDEALVRALERPTALAAEYRAVAADRTAVARRRAATLPTVNVALDVTHRGRDFDFSTPLGDLTLGDRTSTSTAIEIIQPLLEPAQVFYRSKASRTEAVAAASDAQRVRQELAASAARSFLQVLAIDANLRSTNAFIASLAANLDEMQQRVTAGRTLEAEALKVRLDLESAELDRQILTENRRVAVYDLGRAVGHDGAVEPVFDDPPAAAEGAESIDSLLADALASRPDVAALTSRVQALDLRARAVRAERLPRLSARVSWVQADGDPFLPEDLMDGRVGLTWNPFAAGTRAPRIATLEAQRGALEADLAELRRGVEVQVRDALARLATARAADGVRRRGVELASETLRVERERNRVGRATTNDLLDAEAALRRQRTLRDLARIDILRSWFELRLATGGESPEHWARRLTPQVSDD